MCQAFFWNLFMSQLILLNGVVKNIENNDQSLTIKEK